MSENDKLESRKNALINLFSRAPIKKTFGMELSFNDNDSAVFTMPYNPGLDHALNQTHGGAIATLIDNAGWFTVAACYDTWVATVEMHVRLLEIAERKDLVSTGKIIKKGKRLAVAAMEVRTGEGRLIAVGSGTFTVTPVSYDEELK